MNNCYKTSPSTLTIIPPFFLLYILAPNKIKRPILRKKGTAHSGRFGLLLSKKYYAFLSS